LARQDITVTMLEFTEAEQQVIDQVRTASDIEDIETAAANLVVPTTTLRAHLQNIAEKFRRAGETA
jgi:hypothetical protein